MVRLQPAAAHGCCLLRATAQDATINAAGGAAYTGLDRFDCRKALWADMEAQGLVLKVEPHTQRVPRSQRGGEVIEPLVSAQWFVKPKCKCIRRASLLALACYKLTVAYLQEARALMDGMAARALDAVATKDITIMPERFEK
eukprot:8042-Heterococcus_DN1.PRE.6